MRTVRKLWHHFLQVFEWKVVIGFAVLWGIFAYLVFDLYWEDFAEPYFISPSGFLLLMIPCFFYLDSKLLRMEKDSAELYLNFRLKETLFVVKPVILLCFAAFVFLTPLFLTSILVILIQGIKVPWQMIVLSYLAKLCFLVIAGLPVRIAEPVFAKVPIIYLVVYIFCAADYILGYSRQSYGGISFLLRYVCSRFLRAQAWVYILGTFAVLLAVQIFMQRKFKEYRGGR